jgi:hypothetical protein
MSDPTLLRIQDFGTVIQYLDWNREVGFFGKQDGCADGDRRRILRLHRLPI